jgi:hypothetical protein
MNHTFKTTYLFIYNKANRNSYKRKSLKKRDKTHKFTKTELNFNKTHIFISTYKITKSHPSPLKDARVYSK